MNVLIKSKHGRYLILEGRIATIFALNSINFSKAIKEGVRVMVSNMTYNRHNNQCLISSEHIDHSDKRFIVTFGNNILLMEKNIVVLPKGYSGVIEDLEDTRVHDLYLLSQMIKKDNTFAMGNISLNTLEDLADRSEATVWPPRNYTNKVAAFSAYQVLRQAIDTRKKEKVNERDESNYWEIWTVTTSEDPKEQK